MQSLRIGSLAPDLRSASFLLGSAPELGAGRANVIDFWATWCPPCRATLPHLARMARRHPGVGFAAVSVETDAQTVRRYTDSHPELRALAVAFDPSRAAFRTWMTAAGKNGIPTTFVVNGSGRIVWIGHPSALESEISLGSLLGDLPHADRPTPNPAPAASTPPGTNPPRMERLRFVNLPPRWSFADGNLLVELSVDQIPRATSVRTIVRVDGQVFLDEVAAAPVFSIVRSELSPGRHLFEAVRRDFETGREFVADRAWMEIVPDFGGPPRPLPAPHDGGPWSRIHGEVFRRTNAERERVGVAPLRANVSLTRAAQDYAELMRQSRRFSHTGPDGSQPADRARRAGYASGWCGENIAKGQRDAREVIDCWMRSQGHRENILRPEFREIGIGYSDGHWVQLFGSPR